MQDINQVALTARLTVDPELRSTPSGTSVATLRVAIQRPGDRGAAFYDVEVWGKLAESCTEFLAKGSRVGIAGRLEHQEWNSDNGSMRQRNYVVAEQVNFLDRPAKAERDGSHEAPAAA
ncbi:MAG: single-stranded DNA-binding protein [Solirubrobacterales bacterium]